MPKPDAPYESQNRKGQAANEDGENPYRVGDPAQFGLSLVQAAIKGQRVLSTFLAQQANPGMAGEDPLNISGAFASLFKALAEQPAHVAAAQTALLGSLAGLVQSALARARGEEAAPLIEPAPGDRRFRDKDWRAIAFFDFLKQAYLLAVKHIEQTITGTNMEPRERARALFYTRQITDALSPSNFLFTNPEVVRATLSSNGENLLRGLDNMLADLERGKGQLLLRQTSGSFVPGRNIAATPGKVVFRNALIELLQYEPATRDVHETPLLIFPPWINKFYILDLRPENSFVRWAVSRGHSVFMVSWVNPTPAHGGKDFEDYMREGIFAALDAVEKATGAKQANVIGYCIAGTLLAASLAYTEAGGEYKDRVKSATFFAAQTDFSDAGELQVFIDDKQLTALERQMRAVGGVLEGAKMASAFNMLRANDLIWSFVINNYLLGKEPAPFDLLYWNSDTTRMPMKLHMRYLKECYRDNTLSQARMKLAGRTLDLAKIKTPAFFQAAKEDHIAPPASVYKGARLFGGPVTFVLAGSGHIAGVVNPPEPRKYQHWTNDAQPETLAQWQEGAAEHPGSWWPMWDAWIARYAGEKVPARRPGGGLKILGDAPGTYVLAKAENAGTPATPRQSRKPPAKSKAAPARARGSRRPARNRRAKRRDA